jgi:hypothetical protein
VTTDAEQRGARCTDLNPTRTKSRPTPGTGTPGAAEESDPLVIADPPHKPNARTAPSPHLATEPANDTDDEKRVPTTMRERWARIWPTLLAAVTLSAVGGPAAVASYHHARDVIAEHGDPVMAPWLALTTDGMLLAALVVIWVRRHRGEHIKAGPWAAFWAGMTATMAANLAAAQPTPVGIVVALWPPVCLAITLELVALVASPAKQHPVVADARPGQWTGHLPDDAQPAPGHAPAVPALDDRAPEAGEAGHDTGTNNRHPVRETPAEPTAETTHAPAAAPTGTNGHIPTRVPAAPALALRDLSGSTGQVPASASRHGSGVEAGHEAGQNGHGGPVRTGRVPDGEILTWLRHQARTTGQVPGRRKVIEDWELGSTRADRLRAIVINEAASKGPYFGGADSSWSRPVLHGARSEDPVPGHPNDR